MSGRINGFFTVVIVNDIVVVTLLWDIRLFIVNRVVLWNFLFKFYGYLRRRD